MGLKIMSVMIENLGWEQAFDKNKTIWYNSCSLIKKLL